LRVVTAPDRRRRFEVIEGGKREPSDGGLSKMLDSIIEDLAGGAAVSAVQCDEIEADP
jgi:hypothetical protein